MKKITELKELILKVIISITLGLLLGLGLIGHAENVEQTELRRKILLNRIEKASPQAQIMPLNRSLSEIGMIYPSGKWGAREGLKKPETWPEPILLAAFLNTECRNCVFREKKLLLEALRNRVENNYDGYGKKYFSQIFARRYSKKYKKWIIQFSGVGTPKYIKKYFFYNRDDIPSIENYLAVWEVIVQGERTLPCNVTDFLFPAASDNEKEIARQARNRYMPYKNFYKGMYHRLAISKKIKCYNP